MFKFTYRQISLEIVIEIWNPSNPEKSVFTLYNNSAIEALNMIKLNSEEVLVSGSNDNTIKIWRPPSLDPCLTLQIIVVATPIASILLFLLGL